MSIRVLIADDEHFARQRIELLLRGEHDVEVVGECENGADAIECLRQRAVDLVFLDIQMPGTNIFELLPQLDQQELPLIVFITAYDDHAVRAFEVSAFDYILKPFEPARLKHTLQRARVHLARVQQELNHQRILALLEGMRQGTPAVRQRFAVKNDGRIFFVGVGDVAWIEAEHNYIRIHTEVDSYLLRERLTTVEAELDRQTFRRIHRSTIVNVNRVRELQPWFRGDYLVVLQNGRELTMSRTYRDNFKDLLS